jgi:hypothetical protein
MRNDWRGLLSISRQKSLATSGQEVAIPAANVLQQQARFDAFVDQ